MSDFEGWILNVISLLRAEKIFNTTNDCFRGNTHRSFIERWLNVNTQFHDITENLRAPFYISTIADFWGMTEMRTDKLSEYHFKRNL